MIYIVSNRNITDFQHDEKIFGDSFNENGPEVIRVAKAEYNNKWSLTLLPEDLSDLEVNEPTHDIFKELSMDSKPCVIFIHGFNQSLRKNLEKCKEIESYGVNVIAFSWPSNPGPHFILRKIKEYKRARKNARRSVFALERFFDKLELFVESQGSAGQIKTLVVHSMGNYLVQSFVSNPDYDNQTRIFQNILLHQADVDSYGHNLWVDTLARESRVVITINETDDVLDFSDVLNPDRLGNTAANFYSHNAKYYDFTRARGAEDSHRLWYKPAKKNTNIKSFFLRTFHGLNIQRVGVVFDPVLNCYEVD